MSNPTVKIAISLLLSWYTAQFARGESTAPIWIDVRSPAEFASAHLPQAINIPYDEIAIRIVEVAPSRDADIRVYCAIGVRAEIAKLALEARGYQRVTNEGGLERITARCKKEPTLCALP